MGLKLINCKKCNRLFSSTTGSPFCSRCNTEVDDKFEKVRDYIYDNTSCGLKEVSDACHVEVEVILKWIKEGRIIITQNSAIKLCAQCGEPTISGKYCQECIAKIQSDLAVDPADFEQEPSDYRGMHIKSKK